MPAPDPTWPTPHQALAAALYHDKPHAYRLLRSLDTEDLLEFLGAVRTLEYLIMAIFILHPIPAQQREAAP